MGKGLDSGRSLPLRGLSASGGIGQFPRRLRSTEMDTCVISLNLHWNFSVCFFRLASLRVLAQNHGVQPGHSHLLPSASKLMSSLSLIRGHRLLISLCYIPFRPARPLTTVASSFSIHINTGNSTLFGRMCHRIRRQWIYMSMTLCCESSGE